MAQTGEHASMDGHWCCSPRGVKVSPKVDFFLLAPTDEGLNIGLRDKVLCLPLDFHMVRMSFFKSIKSALVALKSSSELRCRISLNTP